ncbi:MAG: VWA domain-containing protein [Myxococcales bacterium]|nr:VWA domain-containing protein [Myxococcales bacterium]
MDLAAFAEQSSLVVFLMLDRSGSMARKTDEETTKAQAVRDALAEFLGDPASEGLGVAAAFFPITRAEVPENCHTDQDCGAAGACQTATLRFCLPNQQTPCKTDADCQFVDDTDTCVEVGTCADDLDQPCLMATAAQGCAPGVECLTWAGCTNRLSCDPAEYAAPVVDVGVLPAARTKLLAALDALESDGGTPTLPALTGVLQAASEWQDAHPSDKAIVLLGTDGLPTACDPAIASAVEETTEGVPAVVKAAESGVDDGVQTFVVGVFTPAEKAMATFALGKIADAGGTGQAYIVTTDDSVSAELVSRFNAIRAQAWACEYAIPWPAQGGIDPDSLTVTVGASAVPRVASLAHCGATTGGYYFDREPRPGVLPHRVVLCPQNCGTGAAPPPPKIGLVGECRVEHH